MFIDVIIKLRVLLFLCCLNDWSGGTCYGYGPNLKLSLRRAYPSFHLITIKASWTRLDYHILQRWS